MTGVVLCGGQSSRMGKDKGLLQHESSSWAQLAANKLTALHLPVVLSVNSQQYDSYNKLFQNPILIKDDDSLNIGGPLKGLLSVYLQLPAEDLLVLACDMRYMKIEVLQQLLKTNSATNAEAIVFDNENTIEPLCAVYKATGLKKIYDQYSHGLLKKFSMYYILQLLNTCCLPVPQEWRICFTNFNTPEDLSPL